MKLLTFASAGALVAAGLFAATPQADLAPTGTLRGIFLGRNPAQAVRDAATGEYAGRAGHAEGDRTQTGSALSTHLR
jgi:hypothetical protein